ASRSRSASQRASGPSSPVGLGMSTIPAISSVSRRSSIFAQAASAQARRCGSSRAGMSAAPGGGALVPDDGAGGVQERQTRGPPQRAGGGEPEPDGDGGVEQGLARPGLS